MQSSVLWNREIILQQIHTRVAAACLAAFVALPMVAPLACAVPEGAGLSKADSTRMNQFEAARVRGLGEALLGTESRDRALVSALFAPGIEPIDTLPDGNYRCRTIKLGGILPLTAYTDFSCRISDGGTVIEKTSGSQRFTGTLTPSGDALFFQGALHYNDDPAGRYGADPEMDQVGCLYKVKDQAIYRLEKPYPLFESTHDVIELIPAN